MQNDIQPRGSHVRGAVHYQDGRLEKGVLLLMLPAGYLPLVLFLAVTGP
jgi:hypothetical protein